MSRKKLKQISSQKDRALNLVQKGNWSELVLSNSYIWSLNYGISKCKNNNLPIICEVVTVYQSPSTTIDFLIAIRLEYLSPFWIKSNIVQTHREGFQF